MAICEMTTPPAGMHRTGLTNAVLDCISTRSFHVWTLTCTQFAFSWASPSRRPFSFRLVVVTVNKNLYIALKSFPRVIQRSELHSYKSEDPNERPKTVAHVPYHIP